MEEEYIREEYESVNAGAYLKNLVIPLTTHAYRRQSDAVSRVEETYTRNKEEWEQNEYRYMRDMFRDWLDTNTKYEFGEDIPIFELFEKYLEDAKENDIFKRDKKRAYLLFIRYVGIWRNVGAKTIFFNNKKKIVAVLSNYTYKKPHKNITESENLGQQLFREKITHEMENAEKQKQLPTHP